MTMQFNVEDQAPHQAASRAAGSELDAARSLLNAALTDDPDTGDQGAAAPNDEPAPAPVPNDGPDEPGESQQIGDQALVDLPGGDTDDAELTLAALAEKTGLTIEQVYAVQIPRANDAGLVSLGELKDSIADLEDLEEKRTRLEAYRTDTENEGIRTRQELQELIALLPEIPPELAHRAQQKHTEHVDAERIAMLQAKPEWRDPAVYQAAQGDMVEAIAEYGFKRNDLDLILDHRLTKLLYDFAQMKKRIAKANARFAEVNKGARKTPQKQKGPRGPTQKEANKQAAIQAAKTDKRPGAELAAARAVLEG